MKETAPTIAVFTVAVLTVSDRCSRGEMADTAGPAVVELVRQSWPTARVETDLLPDDADRIAARLKVWVDGGASLVLTVGGTGFGPRDITPEATRKVIDREAPGLAEAMRAAGSQANKYAWLSRGIAGLAGRTVIVNLPGSQRGATESFSAIAHLLRHAVEVAAGGQRHP